MFSPTPGALLSVSGDPELAQSILGPIFNPTLTFFVRALTDEAAGALPDDAVWALPARANNTTKLIINDIFFIMKRFRPTKIIYFGDFSQKNRK
jgi:hypothetical protein